ncbi:ArsR/SmtB family transcription factor [Paenibacillus typhae]|nr:metalloregulator ArsR/SmtB family transcription factor [Paenibacillus typhae]
MDKSNDYYNVDNDCACSPDELEKIGKEMIQEHIAEQVADWFKAFSDVTRVKLISLLMQKELCVNDLSRLMDMNQSAVSHQLRFLRNSRIVKRRKVGKTVFYALDDAHIEQIFTQTLLHAAHDNHHLDPE